VFAVVDFKQCHACVFFSETRFRFPLWLRDISVTRELPYQGLSPKSNYESLLITTKRSPFCVRKGGNHRTLPGSAQCCQSQSEMREELLRQQVVSAASYGAFVMD